MPQNDSRPIIDRNLQERRRALGQMAAVGAALTFEGTIMSQAARADEQSELPIVDTHQHLWDLEKFNLPWTESVPSLKRSYLLKDYEKATEGLNVVKTVYMEVDVEPSQQIAEAEYVLELCKRPGSKMAGAVISGRPASPGFKEYILRYRDNPLIKGVRQVLHVPSTPKGYCLVPQFVKSVQLLGELGKSFDLTSRGDELEDCERLVAACPDTRFVLDHCGNANVQAKDRSKWEAGIGRIAKHKNVIAKISGIIASAKPGEWTVDDLAPIVNTTIDRFGFDRVVFGGDWPVCTLAATYRQWVDALREIVRDRSIADQRKLFHDNAVSFYALATVAK